MNVPLTTLDFLPRAARIYPDRIAIVDEPDQPAPSLGTLDYRTVARLASRWAASLDGLGIGLGERNALNDIPCERRVVLGEESDTLLHSTVGEPIAWTPDEDATATINYTSGTTARPKGVRITHRNLWSDTLLMGLHLGVNDHDVYLHTLPTFHANGWGMPFVLAGLGVKQVVIRKITAPRSRGASRSTASHSCAAPRRS